jgi:chemotaxis response regulator CheB
MAWATFWAIFSQTHLVTLGARIDSVIMSTGPTVFDHAPKTLPHPVTFLQHIDRLMYSVCRKFLNQQQHMKWETAALKQKVKSGYTVAPNMGSQVQQDGKK